MPPASERGSSHYPPHVDLDEIGQKFYTERSMKLSTRSTYGMRALVELALTDGGGSLSAAAIGQRQALSVPYLEQILHRLKRQGLVSSARGPRGGYTLAKARHQITMAEVVRVLEVGPGSRRQGGRAWQFSVPGGKLNGNGRTHPPVRPRHRRHARRTAEAVWYCVHERLMQSLDTVTLQDLCDHVRSEPGTPLDQSYMFHI